MIQGERAWDLPHGHVTLHIEKLIIDTHKPSPISYLPIPELNLTSIQRLRCRRAGPMGSGASDLQDVEPLLRKPLAKPPLARRVIP